MRHRRAALPCRCLDVRVQLPLPAGLPESIDVITSRALRLSAEIWSALGARLAPEGRVLLWVGEHDPGTAMDRSIGDDRTHRKIRAPFIAFVAGDMEAAGLIVDVRHPQILPSGIRISHAAGEE